LTYLPNAICCGWITAIPPFGWTPVLFVDAACEGEWKGYAPIGATRLQCECTHESEATILS
jgi:hypothetical protein